MERLAGLGFLAVSITAAIAYAVGSLARFKAHCDMTGVHPRAMRLPLAQAHRRVVSFQRTAMTTALLAAAAALGCHWLGAG